MSRLAAAVWLDLRLQWRYGAVAAAALAASVWIGVLSQVPDHALDAVVPLILFGDSALVGFFFLPAMVLFEKGERTLSALVVTPLRFGEYLASKLGTFTGLALASTAIVVAGARGVRFDPLPLVVGVTLLSVLTLLISLIMVARFDLITSYIIGVQLPMAPFGLPLLGFFGWVSSPLLWVFPTHGALRLIGGAFTSVAPWEVAAAVGYQLAWIVALVPVARRAFQRHIVAVVGGVPPDLLARGGT